MDAPRSSHSFRPVHCESGEQLFAAPEEYLAQGGTANAGTVSWNRELDGGRNPLACPLEPGNESGRTGTGGCSEAVANGPPGDPALPGEYSRGLGIPGDLAVSASVGRWRQMSEVLLSVMPCDNRGTDNLLVPDVPGGTVERVTYRRAGVSAVAGRGRL